MKMKRIILPIAAIMLSSCAADMNFTDDYTMGPLVTGKVTDTEGNPIEHIKVTLDWGQYLEKSVVFTSNNGTFKAEAILASEGQTTLHIRFEDIDGEANGGIYETFEETIILYEEDVDSPDNLIRFEMDFRLNHATASESSPQS